MVTQSSWLFVSEAQQGWGLGPRYSSLAARVHVLISQPTTDSLATGTKCTIPPSPLPTDEIGGAGGGWNITSASRH